MTAEETKEALKNSVKHLKKSKIIKTDKDITEKTGYKKSAVSLYVNGPSPVSEEFLEKFEEVFGIKVADYRVTKDAPKTIEQNNSQNDTDTRDLIDFLKKSLLEKTEEIKRLNNIIERLNEIKQSINDLQAVRQLADNNRVNLEKVVQSQETLVDLNSTFRETIALYVTKNPEQARSLLRTASKAFSRNRKEKS